MMENKKTDSTQILIWHLGKSYIARHGSIIGRDTPDVCIEHNQVSREHAQLNYVDGFWSITDLQSTNGLSQGQGRVAEVKLVPGHNQFWLGPPETAPMLFVDLEDLGTRQKPPKPPSSSNHTVISGSPVEETKAHSEVASLADPNMLDNLGRKTGVFQLTNLVLGRDPLCDITLDDPLVSRRHAELNLDAAGNGVIQDLTSANGTFVNGQRVNQAVLRDGDLIELGRHQFLLTNGKLEQHIAYGLPLQAQNLNVTVGDNLKILQDVSFMLPAGSMTAIVGPSGSGKSTLLNALTGRRKADTGSVFLGGRDLYSSQESIGRSIGFVPQDDPIHETITVRKAITAAAKLREPKGTSNKQIAADVIETAKELGLGNRLDTKISSLSGGQKKRVSVGYEMVSAPQALILDEPTSGLDPGLERELMLNLRELANKGTTTVVVTHSVQSLELCDQVIVLAPGGCPVYIGKQKDLAEYFNCSTIAEVFNILSSSPSGPWINKFRAEESQNNFTNFSSNINQHVDTPKRSFFFDLKILTKRYIHSLLGDKKKLAMMLLQPPLIGLLVAFSISRNAFAGFSGTTTYYYVLVTVLVMTWFGTFNSIREIVDEKKQFRREKAVGVSSNAFVISKWIVLVAIVTIQAASLHLFTSIRQTPRIGYGALFKLGEIEYIFALIGVGAACVGIGLVVSSLAKDAARAVVSLPIVLLVIVLFSGLLLPTEGRPVFEQASWANPVQWGGSATAATVDLQNANGCNNTSSIEDVEDLEGLIELMTPRINCSTRWDPTPSNQKINFFMTGLLSLMMLILAGGTTRWTLSRPDNR